MVDIGQYSPLTTFTAPTTGVYIADQNSAFWNNISATAFQYADKLQTELGAATGIKDQNASTDGKSVAPDGLLGAVADLTSFGRGYRTGSQQVFATQKQAALTDQIVKLQEQYPADPEGFNRAYAEVKKTWLADVSTDLLPHLSKIADQQGLATFSRMKAEGLERQKQEQAMSALTEFDRLRTEVYDGILSGRMPQDIIDQKQGQAVSIIEGAMRARYLSPVQARQEIEQQSFNVKTAEILKAFRNNPSQGFVEAIKNSKESMQFGGGTPFTPEQRQQLGAKLDSELNQMMSRARAGQAQAAAGLRKQFNDHITQTEDTGQGILSPDQIKAAFAGNPAAQEEALAMSNQAMQRFTFRQQTGLTSAAEDQALLQQHAPVPNTPGYADQRRSYQQLQQVVANKWQSIEQDPAQYVMSASPEIRQMITSDDAATRSLGYSTLRQVQTNMGLGPGSVALLPKAQAQTIAANINATAITEPGKAAEMTMAIDQQFGENAPAVRQQLARLDTPLNQNMQVISIMNPEARPEMIDAISRKPGELTDMLDKSVPGIRSSIDQKVQSYLTEFERTVDAQNDPRLKSSVRNSVEQLAYLRASRGVSPDEAARTAAKDVIGRYDFVGLARVPKGMAPTVEAAQTEALRNLKPSDLQPVTGRGDNPIDTPEYRQQQQYNDILRSRRFVTNPDGSGTMLTYSNGRPVILSNGATVRPSGPTVEPSTTGPAALDPATQAKALTKKQALAPGTPANSVKVDVARDQVEQRIGNQPRRFELRFNEMKPATAGSRVDEVIQSGPIYWVNP